MSKFLTNEDFRKLLATPRRESGGGPQSSTLHAGEATGVGRKKSSKDKSLYYQRSSKHGSSIAPEGYRDRAAERRMGITMVEDADTLEHAVKSDLEEFGRPENDIIHAKDVDYDRLVESHNFPPVGQFKASEGEATSGELYCAQPMFRSPFARRLFDCLTGKKEKTEHSVEERFLPRRMAFVYDMESANNDHIPTILQRAKEDCPVPARVETSPLSTEIISTISKALELTALADRKKTKRRGLDQMKIAAHEGSKLETPGARSNVLLPLANKQSSTEAGPADDEDIFADAGTDYVVERRKVRDQSNTSGTEAVTAQRSERLFCGALEEDESKFPTSKPVNNVKKKVAANVESRRSSDTLKEDIDEYVECYPSYYYGGHDMYDSDNGTHNSLDKGNEVKNQRNMSKNKAAKHAAKEENKLGSQLTKIQKIFDEKGYEHSSAFDSNTALDRSTGNREEESIFPIAAVKRRRI